MHASNQLLLFILVMPDDPEIKKHIFRHLSCTDVVNDQVSLSIIGSPVRNDPDMSDASTKVPANQVTRLVLPGIPADRFHNSMPRKELHEVGNPPVVDVFIRP